MFGLSNRRFAGSSPEAILLDSRYILLYITPRLWETDTEGAA